ncbi:MULTISPECIES: hypothetical protein [unclassified Pseudovibrio]|uniref:hypothetical protein n=1 Tax=unclassified Pseudovibrio TaxID=2627060 RepID=UPI0007AEE577|nr:MULTISPECIES: hypothetical protein [unclassified Pseudovibrio]KZK98846.1 hypothetical protein PsW74_03435 [Pseudovibrio sp. W74]KZL09339.1 hypothetical protein PsAD14_02400 [Pseudovibrio sp. Ad14]
MEIELNRSEQKLQGASSSYEALSGHDRAILHSMIMEPTVSQIVPRGFPKDRFLDEISQRGWARPVEVEPEMTANGAFRCWQITDKGSKRLPTYLLAISTAKITKEMAANSTAVLIRFLLKFSICYLALLVLFAALGFTATKLQISLTGTGGYLSIAVVTVSLFGALYFSSRLWVFKKSEDKRLQNIAYGQFIREKTKIVSILLAGSFLAIHGSVDLLTVAIGLKAELGAPIRLLIQSALLSVLAMIFLPGILDKRLKQQVKKRAAAL